jgi:hypothetical protein
MPSPRPGGTPAALPPSILRCLSRPCLSMPHLTARRYRRRPLGARRGQGREREAAAGGGVRRWGDTKMAVGLPIRRQNGQRTARRFAWPHMVAADFTPPSPAIGAWTLDHEGERYAPADLCRIAREVPTGGVRHSVCLPGGGCEFWLDHGHGRAMIRATIVRQRR